MTHALAAAHTAEAQPFNGLFYATCATVIPVLFLALAVQGRGLTHMLRIAGEERPASPEAFLTDPARLFPRRALLAAGYLIMTVGFVGEATAIYGLYDRHAGTGNSTAILAATIILLLAVVTGPLLSYHMAIARPRIEARLRATALAQASQQQRSRRRDNIGTRPRPGTTADRVSRTRATPGHHGRQPRQNGENSPG